MEQFQSKYNRREVKRDMSKKIQEGYAIVRETGEALDLIIDKEVSSQNFWKIWLSDILTVMGIISNSKQLDVVLYIMQNIKQSDNTFIGTYESVSKSTNISEKTVATAFRTLLKNDFIRRIGYGGLYQVNPKYIIKGNESKRRMIINYFNQLSAYPNDDRKANEND